MNNIKLYQPSFTKNNYSECLGQPAASKQLLQGRDRVSFNGITDKIAQKTADAIANSQILQTFLKTAEKNASYFDALVSLGIVATLRPFAIMAVPGAKKEDKQVASAKSVASGIVGLIFAAMVYLPLARSMEKLATVALRTAAKSGTFPYKLGTREYDAFNYLINFGSGFILAPLEAFILFKSIPPIINRIFPNKDKHINPLPTPAAKLSADQQQLIDEFVKKSGAGGNIR